MHTTHIEVTASRVLSKTAWLCGFVLLSLGLGPRAFGASPDDEVIEEVVVTGSYLKRTAADSPSPLSVIGAAQIEDLGAADVAEVIASLPWQSGSQTRASTFQGEGADGRNSINLRNLGHGATLAAGDSITLRPEVLRSSSRAGSWQCSGPCSTAETRPSRCRRSTRRCS